MSTETNHKARAWVETALTRLPVLSSRARQRGAAAVISYAHRVTGILVVGFIGFHLLTLQALREPAAFDAKMRLYGHPLLIFLEWSLTLPVMFHALNGGRLVLFESFGCRKDGALQTWMTILWLLYCALLGVTMLTGGPPLPAGLYWLWALAGSAVLVFMAAQQIWPTAHHPLWKLQRLSGVFLIVMVPAHLLFMHIDPAVAKDAATVLARIQSPFIKMVDIAIAAAVIYHGACGLVSIAGDYIASRFLFRAVASLATGIAVFFGILALRLFALN